MLSKNFSSYIRFCIGLVSVFLLGFGFQNVNAQFVNVTGASVGNGSYFTLGAAFTAINGGPQPGAVIVITIVGNTAELSSAVLNQSAIPWTSVTITPVGARTVAGSVNGPLISFNGADFVKIDGINSGGNSLIINNQSTSSIASTIKFLQDAQNNQVVNCTILGSSNGAANSSEGATVLFSTCTSGTGNDRNLIATNDIGPSGLNLPFQAVKSVGTAARENSNNIINNNRIYDFFSAANLSNARGIMLGANTTGWVVTSNRLYQTATRSATTSGTNLFSFIEVQSGSGYTMNGNYLGFANASATGYTTINGGGSNIAFMIQALIFNQTTNNTSSLVSNVIGGIIQSSSRATSTSGENIFLGVHFSGGSTGQINFTSNTIGSGTAFNSIQVQSTSLSGGSPKPLAGIYNRSAAQIYVDGNTVGGIALTFAGTAGQDVFQLNGILNEGDGVFDVTNNTIGGSIANSITSTHVGGNIVGINNTRAMVSVNIMSNIVRNLTHTGNNVGLNAAAAVIGIMEKIGGGNMPNTISDNQVYNLNCSFVTGSSIHHVKGILVNPLGSSSQPTTIERNIIHSLNVTSTAIASSINGIHLLLNGTAYTYNNMISLGNGLTGNKKIVGILQTGMATFAYHNSIRIMGTATGTDLSACYSYTTGGNVLRTWNNIFYNERTGGANNHYTLHTQAIAASYQASNNLYYSAGPAFAMYNNVAYGTIAALSVATAGQNNPTNTLNLPVVFVSATDLHTSDLNVRNAGATPLTPVVTLDIDKAVRPTCVDIGCDEFDTGTIPGTAFTWMGTINNQWCQACNWDRETVPAATDDVIIKDDRTNYPLLQPGVGCGDVTVHDFTVLSNVVPGKSGSIDLGVYTLSVTGDIAFAGSCLCTGSSGSTAINTGLIDLIGTTQSQSVDIKNNTDTYPGVICKLRVNKTQPTGIASANHEAYLRGNLIILYNLDFSNGVLLSKTAGTFDADELTATNYKTILVLNEDPSAVTRQTIGAQNTRNGFFQGRLSRRIKAGASSGDFLFPLGFRLTGGTGVLANYFYTPALMKANSIGSNNYLTATYLHDQNNPNVDGVGIGFTGHGCLNAFEIDDQGGATASTCNNKEIDVLSTYYWDFQEASGTTAGGDMISNPGALGAVDFDLETAGDVYTLLAQDGLTGSELRLLRRPSVIIPGNLAQGPFVTTVGTHNGTNISANTGIAMYSIDAASLKGARRDGLTSFGGFGSAGNGPSPLPVELLYFNAKVNGERSVLCSWETATEINNDHFEVEAARDRGGDLVFETIGWVQGFGTSSQNHAYSFVDEKPSTGRNYYRLRQVDFDGTAGYSKIVVVQFNSGKKFEVISSSPNPFISNPELFVQTELGGPLSLRVENSIGQLIFSKELVVSKGYSRLVLELPAELASGIYFVRTSFDEEQQVIRLLKQ